MPSIAPEPASNGNGFRLSGWGATLQASGRDVVLVLVLIAGFGTVALLLRDIALRFDVAMAERSKEHVAILDHQDNMACVLLIPQDERNRYTGDPRRICDYLQLKRGLSR